MKYSKKSTCSAVLALALLILVASSALAGDKITYENGQLTIENLDDDKVVFLNTDGMQEIITDVLSETLESMDEVLAELDEMQLEIHVGNDNMVRIETDDQMWEMNLNVVFNELSNALEMAFDEVNTEDWTSHEHWESTDDINEEELSDELEQLKDELRKLKNEMESLKEL